MNKKQRIELRKIYRNETDIRRFSYDYINKITDIKILNEVRKFNVVDMSITFSRVYNMFDKRTNYIIHIQLPIRKILHVDLSIQETKCFHSFEFESYRKAKNKYTEILNMYGIFTLKQQRDEQKRKK